MTWALVTTLLVVTVLTLSCADSILGFCAPLLNRLALYLGLQIPTQEAGSEYVGKSGTVAEVGTKDSSELRVELSGTTWRARKSGGASLSVGDPVRIVRMDGLTLIVEKEIIKRITERGLR